MAATAAPYGFRPVKRVDGMPYAGAFRQYKIDSGYGTNIYYGSIVSVDSNGLIALVTTNGDNSTGFPAGTIGVFVGCEYTDPNLKYKVQRQYWPTGTVASDAKAFVVDDPNVLFQAQANGSLDQATLQTNIYLAAVQSTSTGSTLTGNSTTALAASSAASTSGFAFRIVEFVENNTSTVGDAYTDVLVKFNVDSHAFLTKAGI